MKRIVTLLVLLLSVCPLTRGQEIISITKGKKDNGLQAPQERLTDIPKYEYLQYKDCLRLYDARNYVPRYDDPYQPFAAGLVSYFVPGLGQTLCGEAGRGLSVFLTTELMATSTLLSLLYTPGLFSDSKYYYYGEQAIIQQPSNWDHIRNVTMVAGTCALYVWNIFDAVKVAKIKNMYHQDICDYPIEDVPEGLVFRRNVHPYMRYRDYKNLYDASTYRARWGDPYSPVASGFLSALFPGLGHFAAGELGRGFCFLGGYMSLALAMGGLASDNVSSTFDSDFLRLVTGSAFLGVYIWSICDAVKVAKIKNLYMRDICGDQVALDFNLQPYFNCVPTTTGNNRFVGGLALTMNF